MKELLTHEDYPNYKFSSGGKVWSNKANAYMKTQTNKNGYKQLGLVKFDGKRKMLYIHRLIAELFVLKTSGNQVNHKDGDKLNNHYKNLEWVTPTENMKHARDTGLFNQDGVNNGSAKFDNETIARVFTLVDAGLTQAVVGAILNMSQQNVSQIITGKRR